MVGQIGHREVAGASCRTCAESAPQRASTARKCIKPRIEDVLHGVTVMKHAASCPDEHVYVFTANAKDYFNQLALALWVMPHVGLLWTAFGGHVDYSCIAEYSLGFGYSCASNIAQRFAFGILDIFRREFDADDASFVAADRRRAPGNFAARDYVSSQTGRDECRLAVVKRHSRVLRRRTRQAALDKPRVHDGQWGFCYTRALMSVTAENRAFEEKQPLVFLPKNSEAWYVDKDTKLRHVQEKVCQTWLEPCVVD